MIAGLILLVAGCGDGDKRSPAPPTVDLSEPAPWRDDGLDRVERARREAEAAARRRAELAKLAGVPTVGAALRRALLSGRDRAAGARPLPRRAGRRPHGGATAHGSSRRRAGGRPRLGRAARGRAPAHAEPPPGGLLEPAPQHAHLDAGAVPGRRRTAQLGSQSGGVPVRPGARHAAASAGDLGQGQLAAAPLPAHARRRLPRAPAAAAARRARATARLARRLRRVGVLLRLRAGLAAVDQRDGAGDRDPGALARGGRARRAALRAAGAARARRVRDAAAERRRSLERRRAALRHVLVRAGAPDHQRRAAGDQRPA